MNGMSNSNDDVVECPLCMEPLEVDDLNFYPCTCGYQICRFCWHRIRTDENELCPACRKAYPENPADFTPLSQEQMSALKTEKRQRDQQRKQKITENRKHLANVRVVQKNLVFVVGLPPRLADAETLKKHEYFGKYGKIHKVVINPSTTYAGAQGPSASAYVTYCVNNDALRAIQSVNNIMIDGRLIKTSLGTTKYCSHFMKNQQCPKPDCMYLHELGDSEASFTKEEMHQGKHQEYERRLHDTLIAQSSLSTNGNGTGKSDENGKAIIDAHGDGPAQNNDAWPCLSVSPDNKTDTIATTSHNTSKSGGCCKKDVLSKKLKSDKLKGKKGTNIAISTNTTAGNNSQNSGIVKENGFISSTKNIINTNGAEKLKSIMNADEELSLITEIENEALHGDIDEKIDTPSLSSSSTGDSGTISESASGKSSPSSFPDHSTIQNTRSTTTNPTQQSNDQENSSEHNSVSNGVGSIIDTTARFSKLNLFDDNNSFFSTNTFQPYFKYEQQKQHPSGETHLPTVSSSIVQQLPDLLNGTESNNKETQLDIDKLNLLKGLNDYSLRQSFSAPADNWEAFKMVISKNKQHLQNQSDTDDLLGIQELQKRNNLINSLGLPHYNGGLNSDYSNDYMHNSNDQFSQMIQQQLQQQQQQQSLQQSRLHAMDNLNHIYAGNMSKFFDFHKNQQQQQQNHQLLLNGHSNGVHNNSSSNDHINITNLLENNRINSQFLDHTNNGLLGPHLHKQRMMCKYDQLNTSQQQQQHGHMLHPNIQTNRLQNHFTSPDEDDLGFDPFFETQKGLAELIQNEMIQQQTQNNHSKLLENCQRSRMPPPGFNHMNAFGFGVPRAQNSSKVLPFLNVSNSTQMPQTNNWAQLQQQQQNLNFPSQPQQSHDQLPSGHLNQAAVFQANKSGYGNMSDWTALDPAIVSFRQFPSFISGLSQQLQNGQQPQTQHNTDNFIPHSMHHQQQHHLNGQGLFENKLKNLDYNNRNGLQSTATATGYGGGVHGMNLQNSIINQQQQTNSPAQVNFSHSNWLNSDQNQNIFMNNLSNGFSNHFETLSIPLPPGFQNTGSKQLKSECIN